MKREKTIVVRLFIFSLRTFLMSCIPICMLCAQNTPDHQPSIKRVGPEKIVLEESTTWIADEVEIADGTAIKTNGFPFIIIAGKHFTVEGRAKIYSFDPDQVPSLVDKGTNGADGKSFDRGPGSGGRGESINGENGGAGQPGGTGAKGKPGQNAGSINIILLGDANGHLDIVNDGGNGGSGGEGGNGGKGGDGEQGGRGTPALFGLGAKAGPGTGGSGGKGGDAGLGGEGGNGGNGGMVIINSQKPNLEFHILASTKPGQPGAGGKPGVAGDAGDFGWGGRGAAGVNGRVEERRGQKGISGASGQAGSSGQTGRAGNLQISDQISDDAKSLNSKP